MKNVFYLLLLVITFSACSKDEINDEEPLILGWNGDWNHPKNGNYRPDGYNPISNRWILTYRDGVEANEFLVYKFDSHFNFMQSSTRPSLEMEAIYGEPRAYRINNSQYLLGDSIFEYDISGTRQAMVLTIRYKDSVLKFRPYESGSWSWHGNWNAPEDPNYETYKGKYNPLKGVWKLINVGSVVISYNEFHRFTDDFEWDMSTQSADNGYQRVSEYILNDIGVKDQLRDAYYKYTIEGDLLTIQGKFEKKGVYNVLKKYR